MGVTSANANGGVLQLKSGITFPATASLSTDSNTLDDYEEGTWTPRLSGQTSGTKTTGTDNAGWYRKVGNLVTVGGSLVWNGTEALSGNLVISNLPFSSATGNGIRAGGTAGATSGGGITTTGSNTYFVLVMDPGGNTFIYVIQVNGAAGTYSHNPTVNNSGALFGFEIGYLTDS